MSSKVAIDRCKPNTERGYHSSQNWALSLNDTVAQDFIIDMIHAGGLVFGAFIDNLTASGAGTVLLNCLLSVSMDGINWTNIAFKDLAGTETPAGAFTVATNSSQYITVTLADYPRIMAMRYIRLRVANNSTTANKPLVYIGVK